MSDLKKQKKPRFSKGFFWLMAGFILLLALGVWLLILGLSDPQFSLPVPGRFFI